MTLREYLDAKQISQRKAADELGVTHVHLGYVINGARPGGPVLKRLIWYWSDGAVGLEDWPDYEAPAAEAKPARPAPRPIEPPSYRSGRKPPRRPKPAPLAAAG